MGPETGIDEAGGMAVRSNRQREGLAPRRDGNCFFSPSERPNPRAPNRRAAD